MTRQTYDTEKQLVRCLRENRHIILYGAGMVGELVCRRLLANGLSGKITGFAVSKKVGVPWEDRGLCGFSIYEISELKAYKKDAVVLIATLPNLHKEIAEHLYGIGFEKVIFVTLHLYKELCKRYMSDFRRQNPIHFAENGKTRVLLIASDNNMFSGAFRCMAELCSQLQENGMATAVILPHYGTGTPLLEQKQIPYTYIPSQDWGYEVAKDRDLLTKIRFLAGMLKNYKARQELVVFMKENRIDLVHCNTTYTYIGALAAEKCGIPYVWHFRESMAFQGYRFFMPCYAWRLIRKAARIITVSEYIKSLIPLEERASAVVVYDSVEVLEQFCKRREILQKKTVYMIMVGAIVRYKGQEELIRACALLKEKGIEKFHLSLIGKGQADYVRELEQMIAGYELEEQIALCGVSDRVQELYAGSDLAFVCSAEEAYGRVTIEAQLSGCFVIGPDSGATPELIRDGRTGYLYHAGSHESLAEKIMEVINHPEQSRKIAEAGQEYARKMYTKENNFKQIQVIYEESLRRK